MQNFNYHTHTYRCGHADLDMTDEEYVLEYIKMGFKKIAFTDHCPQSIDKRKDVRMEYSEKEEYKKSIKSLKEKYSDKIEIEFGYEVEYLPGEEEFINELKNESEKIILGQHFIYDSNKKLKILGHEKYTDEDLKTYANYIEKALELNIPNIIVHPDFFMLSRDDFGQVETEITKKICESAEKYNVPLELNLRNIYKVKYKNKITPRKGNFTWDKIAYPCKGFWNIAKDYNIKVVYGMDVHNRGQILLWNELIESAKEIIGEDTINRLNFVEDV